ncbi:MAG: hypothetical protein P1P82_13315 [Bacteroidales bacterium]|nr:hypothetical protein [Bacteroidales bacterium]MDT8433077.1 hypothetical protein [Bacteroidales bacterium]
MNKLTRVIGTLGDSKTNTFDIIKSQRFDQYEEFEGEEKLVPLEHLPLIYIVNNRNNYNREDFYTIGSPEYVNEINYYDSLLNLAEECGVCSYLNSHWSASPSLRVTI